MKNRKFPVIALTGIVLLIPVMAFLGMKVSHTAGLTPEQQYQENMMQQMQDRRASNPTPSAPSREQIASKLKATPAVAGSDEATAGRRDGADEPSVFAPVQHKYKPQKNEAATSAQWYKGGK